MAALLVVFYVWQLFDARQATVDAALAGARNTITSAAQDIRRTMEVMDLSLQAAIAGLQIENLDALRPELRQAVLFDGALQSEHAGGLVVTDALGRVRYSARQQVREPNLSDRTYFARHLTSTDPGLLVTARRRSPDGMWVLALSRRLSGARGVFAGVAVAQLQASFVQQMFDSLSLPSGAALAFYAKDGSLLAETGAAARWPDLAPPLMARLDRDGLSASRPGLGLIAVQHRIGSFPVAVVMILPEVEILRGWRQRAWLSALAFMVFSAIAAVLYLALRRELVRRSAAEQVALDSMEKVKLLTDNASDLLMSVGWDGTRHYVSPASISLMGRRPEDLVGWNTFEFVHPDDRDAVADAFLALRREGTLNPFNYRLRHIDGRWLDVEARARAVPDGSGAIVVVRDISERAQMEAKRRQSQRMEALGQLTAGVAHDFNNVLQAQLGALEMLLDDMPDGSRQHGLAGQALRLSERAGRLTSQLLSYARQQRLTPQPIAPDELANSTAGMLRRVLGPSIRFEFRVEQDLPNLFADRAHLDSALLNLAINARDAMPSGGRIELCAARVPSDTLGDAVGQFGHAVSLTVSDDGPGMSAETLERACEPFFTTKGPNGSGLGLASVHGFAAQSGGRLDIRSSPGKGTSVQLILPAVVQSPVIDTVPGRPMRVGGRILLVDDTPDVLAIIADFLEDEGFEITAMTRPELALSALQADGPFDCLITDYAMPGMTGVDLARRAAEIDHELPVILISGWLDPSVSESLSERMTVLRKPFERARLREAMDTQFSRRQRLSPHLNLFSTEPADAV